MKCPICTVNRATTIHNIDLGGNHDSNKITLCKSCYDIIEDICYHSGLELTPDIVASIKLGYDFPGRDINMDIQKSILDTSLYRLRRRLKFFKSKKVKPVAPDGPSIWCSYCKEWHIPEKNGAVICPVLKGRGIQPSEIDLSHNITMDKLESARKILDLLSFGAKV